MKKKDDWRKTGKLILGFHCARNAIDGSYSFFGVKGEIWPYSDEVFEVVIYCHTNLTRQIRSFLPEGVKRIDIGDELRFPIGEKSLQLWLRILKVPRHSGRQATLANKKLILKGPSKKSAIKKG